MIVATTVAPHLECRGGRRVLRAAEDLVAEGATEGNATAEGHGRGGKDTVKSSAQAFNSGGKIRACFVGHTS